jgi:hypothetical protein
MIDPHSARLNGDVAAARRADRDAGERPAQRRRGAAAAVQQLITQAEHLPRLRELATPA